MKLGMCCRSLYINKYPQKQNTNSFFSLPLVVALASSLQNRLSGRAS